MNAADAKTYPDSQTAAADALHDSAPAPRWLPDERPSPEQVSLLRGMSGPQRLKLAEALYWEARKLKAAGVRHHHPDWSEGRVATEVNRIFLNARS